MRKNRSEIEIEIDPEHEGDFTEKAERAGKSVQEYARIVLNAKKGRFPAATVRQANFARNAKKWKRG